MKFKMKNIHIITLSAIFIGIGAYFFTTHKSAQKPELIQKAQRISYKGAIVLNDTQNIEDMLNEINTLPPAAGGSTYNVSNMANEVTQNMVQAFSSSQKHTLPLFASWNAGIPDYEKGMDPMYMISRLGNGEHIVVSWKLDPYYNNNISDSYYERSIKRAKTLKLPLVFIMPTPESALSNDDYYLSLDNSKNANVLTQSGVIIKELSPFGANSVWEDVGEKWAKSHILKLIQEWYPNPPLIVFVSQNQVNKLSWSDVELSSRYVKKYGLKRDNNFKRAVIDAEWIEKYRQMHLGFKRGFIFSSWKKNVKFISRNSYPQNMGKVDYWIRNSTLTDKYLNIWPLTADGLTINFDLSGSKSDNLANSPEVLANNLPLMIKDAKGINPKFMYQLSLNDNDKIYELARYRGYAQFALWFLRPNIIRQETSKDTRTDIEPIFQELSDSVELIYSSTVLQDFWKNGKLVSNGKTNFNSNIPDRFKKEPRWFLLTTDANPVRIPRHPWSDTTKIDVWAFALVKGKRPNREWLLYVQSPEGDRSNVKIDVPSYKDILVDSSVKGSFYILKESTKNKSNKTPKLF